MDASSSSTRRIEQFARSAVEETTYERFPFRPPPAATLVLEALEETVVDPPALLDRQNPDWFDELTELLPLAFLFAER